MLSDRRIALARLFFKKMAEPASRLPATAGIAESSFDGVGSDDAETGFEVVDSTPVVIVVLRDTAFGNAMSLTPSAVSSPVAG